LGGKALTVEDAEKRL